MESDVLKAVEEISGYTPDEMLDMYNDYGRMAKEWEAYAGTGLTPEEVAHAKDLLAAEKDGRCVVLPCKVGDTVYFVAEGEVRSTTLLAIKANISDPKYAGNPTIIFEGY